MAQQRSSGGGGWLILGAVLLIGYCSFKDDEPTATATTIAAAAINPDDEDDPSTDVADEQGELVDDERTIAGETYPEYDERRDAVATGLYSGSDECTEDCSGHDAGRQWAEQRGVTSADECGGRSWSFVEGCRSYAEEQTGSSSTDTESEEDEP